MTHDFSHDPIKIRVVDVKTGKWKQSYVFVGRVPSNVEKELHRIEKNVNQKNNTILKKFYGSGWRAKIGIGEFEEKSKKGGGNRKKNDRSNVKSDEIGIKNLNNSNILSNIGDYNDKLLRYLGGDDSDFTSDSSSNSGGDDSDSSSDLGDSSGNSNNLDNQDTDKFGIQGGEEVFEIDDDLLNELNEMTVDASNQNIASNQTNASNQTDNLNQVDTNDSKIDGPKQDDDQQVNEALKNKLTEPTDSKDLIDMDDIHTKTQDNFLEDREETMEIKHSGGIKFITNINAYPTDNILDLKFKIYISVGIPIYRQHLWYKYKGKSYPANYVISINNHTENIDIERLIAFYMKQQLESEGKIKAKYNNTDINTINDIEGIPVETEYYKNKDYMHISAQDTFTLLHSIYYKYGVNEFFLADLNDLLQSGNLYEKLRKDKYQMEVIYYGFISLYFPMITISVFQDYLKNERNLKQLYPEMAADRFSLLKKYELQGDITDEAYETLDNKAIEKILYSSITQTIVSIDNHNQDVDMVLSLRNLFDILELNDTVTYCKANVLHDNHNVILKKSYLNEREPKDIIPINSLLIKIKINTDTNENIRIVLFKNGNYVIKTEWREENHMDFKKVIKIVGEKINPIIKMINRMDEQVKYHSIKLMELESKNAVFTETSLTFYYDDDITEARFNILKNILDDYRKAGIIISKENVSLGYEYFFNKGMYKYDPARIEKTMSLDNYYDYLSNGVVKQKWETVFERTRLFQILNVSSKLKINISGIRNDVEMQNFYMYLKGLLFTYSENAKKIKIVGDETVKAKSKKTLKNLKVQDPLLYDFKKIYNSNIVYSRKCQKQYQPVILTDDEYTKLPKDKQSNAIKYWNFTKQKPVWYSCPNAKYPFVKFITKMHPKDFCVPCCKKVAMGENVNKKKQEIHNSCMKEHAYTGEKVNLTKGSHYIASYGKNIEVGRICRLPENTLEPLFFDTYSPEGGIDQECATADGYYLLGVDQHVLQVNDIGMLFCLAHSLNTSIDLFLADCSRRIKKSPEKFRVILDGNIGLYFKDVAEFADTVLSLNKEDAILSNLHEGLPWNLLFMSIGYSYFGINTVMFDDQQKEMIELILPKGLKNPDEMFPENYKNLVVLRKKTKIYPIYLFNTEIFKRTGIIDTRLFLNESGLMAIIKAVVRKSFYSQHGEKMKSLIDLSVVKEFAKDTKTVIQHYYINYSNLCYAVILNYKNKNTYFPVHASHYPMQRDISLIFTPYKGEHNADFDLLNRLVANYNRWNVEVSKKSELEGVTLYPKIEIQQWFKIRGEKQLSGFICNNTNYYCKYISEKDALNYTKKPVQTFLYSPYKINELIHAVKNGSKKIGIDTTINHTLQFSMYNYYLHNLVLLHLINIFNSQRNAILRKKIMLLLAKTDFNKNIEVIRDFLKEIEDVEDATKLKNIIGRYVTQHHDRKQMLNDVDGTYFNFDRITLEKIKTMPVKKVYDELQKLAKTFIKIGKINVSNFNFPNILVACNSKNSTDYCSGNKLIIDKKKLDGILEIIAHDIINPSKWKWIFSSVFIDKFVDYFKFIRRKNETIFIELVS